MGFIRRQEERMALQILEWHYAKKKVPPPPRTELRRQAKKIVEEAHQIAIKRGRHIMTIVRERIDELTKKSRP